MQLKSGWIVLSLSLFLGPTALAATLTLEQFRAQAQKQDPRFRGSAMQAEGAHNTRDSYETVTDLRVVLAATAVDDQRPTQNPDFQGDRSTVRSLSVGLQKQFSLGPSFKLSGHYVHSETLNASPTAVPEPDYYDVFPQIELAVPLWRNLFGRETRAQEGALKAQSEAQVYASDSALIQAQGQIDLIYFLHLANIEQVAIQREILERSDKLHRWLRGQFGRGLTDKADVHQAQAAVTLRQIELDIAEKQLLASGRELNALRGVPSDVVSEQLVDAPVPLEGLLLSKAEVRRRKDLLANEAQARAQAAQFTTLREGTKPQFDFSVKAAQVGRDPDIGEAREELQDKNQTYWYVGVNFVAPLDVFKYNRQREGYAQLVEGQNLRLQAQNRDNALSWQQFVDRGQQLRNQILLLRDLEKTQELKAGAEQTRLTRGRSTTFQVLTFEQDYRAARIQRIGAELEARRFLAEVPLYEK